MILCVCVFGRWIVLIKVVFVSFLQYSLNLIPSSPYIIIFTSVIETPIVEGINNYLNIFVMFGYVFCGYKGIEFVYLGGTIINASERW